MNKAAEIFELINPFDGHAPHPRRVNLDGTVDPIVRLDVTIEE